MTSISEIGKIESNNELLFYMWESEITKGKREYFKHSHTFFEVSLILSGSAEYITPTGAFLLDPDDIVILSGNEYHYSPNIITDDFKMLNFQFAQKFISSHHYDLFTQKNSNYYFAHNESFKSLIPKSESADLKEIILSIKTELQNKEDEYIQMIRSKLMNFFILLFRKYEYSAENDHFPHYSHISKALKYIDENYCGEIKLSEIASYVNLSPTYFSQIFKRFCNISLWDYISSKRIEKAKALINDESNRMTMLEIALECGYNNTANFNKSFKKQLGITPTEYKKSEKML